LKPGLNGANGYSHNVRREDLHFLAKVF
jgi:hypothetical protein